MRALADADFAPNLRHLATHWVHKEVLEILAESPAFAGLVTLSLRIQDAPSAKVLADSPGLRGLRNLDLASSWFGDLGLDALARSALLAHLTRLRISPGSLSASALERLARALPPRCRLLLADKPQAEQRETLSAILGDRLVVQGS
jgi:hypothetical protein